MKYILSVVSLLLLIPIMLFSQPIRESMPEILTTVSQVVFCTLFPANVLLRVFCFSPIAEKLSLVASKTRFWKATGLSGEYLPSVIAGQLSGFPMTACLLPNGENRATALALGSVVSPAFLSAALSPSAGLLLWFNHVLVLYIFASVTGAKPERLEKKPLKYVSFSEALSSGVSSAVAVSGAIIFFSCIITLVPNPFREMASALLEIGTASAVCKTPLFLALAFSFGGLSALSQISFCAENTDLKPYLLSRFFLFLPTLTFFVFEKIRIFQALLLIFLFLAQISRTNTCKKR